MEENLENKETMGYVPPEPQKTGFNKTPLLVAALVILTGLLLIISLSSKKSSQENSSQQAVASGTSLSMGDQKAASTSGSAEIDVNVDTKNKVNGVQLEISYDPTQLKINDIKPGSFFDSPLVISKKIDSEKGLITFLLGRQINQKGVEGKGVVAIINFTKSSSGEAQLSFNPGTIVTADGGSQSILSKTISGLVTSTTSQ